LLTGLPALTNGILSAVPTRLRALSGFLILLAISPLEAANPAAEDRSLEVLESGVAAVTIEARSWSLPYSRTIAGPMFALQPLVALLGGELAIGPMQQKHELTIREASFLFGPGAIAVTEDGDIALLSQAPKAGAGGLHVPLDLLERLYGNLLGYEFDWHPTERTLAIARRPLRELTVTMDVVHLQGVTTLVFEFPQKPRYHLKKTPYAISIELIGDRLRPSTQRLSSTGELVRAIDMTAQSIRVELARQTVAQDYVLENPFRIVFDVLRDRSGGSVAARPERPSVRAHRQGVRTVIIDPGHGGSDPGAGSRNGEDAGAFEKNLTLELARQLEERLEQALNVRVVLTRTSDATLSLDDRSALANQYKGDLLISLHLNSSPNTSARGAETYFSSFEATDAEAMRAAEAANRGDGDPLFELELMLWDLAQSRYLGQSQRFASLVQAELNDSLGLRNRGVKQAPFKVLLGAAMPAVLVEFGFLSNPSEQERLRSAEYRVKLVESLVRAVARYKAQVEQSRIPEAEFSSR
jgi:N-acetylmuramoyl-L-alanine amidase